MILQSIVGQYITRAIPVSSQSIMDACRLSVRGATIRNEVVRLEQEGYVTRPHTSAGSIPLDKGYRHYVESLGDIELPLAEQRLVSHLFHQVEQELDKWLNLAATLMARMVHNAAIVTTPKPEACKLKHLELVSLQDSVVLFILVLSGAKVRQQLITFDHIIPQSELSGIAAKLSAAYSGLTVSQILAKGTGLSITEQQMTDCLVTLMNVEDTQDYEEPYFDGWHFMLNQPEFAYNQRMQALMELVEQHKLMRNIIPMELASGKVRVIIGKENRTEAIHDYSIVISHYGLPEESIGTIGVIGPTRMPYARAITTVRYLSSVLSELVAKLYGKELHAEPDWHSTN